MIYNDNFYKNLKKPKFQPPSFIFKPVWIILYFLMFSSFFIVIFSELSIFKLVAIILFVSQLILNVMWPTIFFKKKNPKLALKVCFLLTVNVFLMILFFFELSKIAGIMNLPYLLWLGFACYLNYSIVKLNYPNSLKSF